nr:hypothetical protein [Acetobacter persici]
MKNGYMESGFEVGDLVQIGTENRDVFSINNDGENAHIIEICQCSLEDIGRGKLL